MTVRYQSLDTIGHYFLRYADPSEFGDVTSDERRRFGTVLEQHYALIDEAIGRSIASLGPDDLLLVVSGYGMEPMGVLKRLLERVVGDPDLSGTHESAPDGFLMAYGGPVARGRRSARGIGRRRGADGAVLSRTANRSRHGRLRAHRPVRAAVHGRASDHLHPVVRKVTNGDQMTRCYNSSRSVP